MKDLILVVLSTLTFSTFSFANPTSNKVIKCGGVEFVAPDKMGDLPSISFYYASKVVQFSLHDGSLLLVAMDEHEPARVRIVISAQLNPKTGKYLGQMLTDYGSRERQLDSDNVTCSVTSL